MTKYKVRHTLEHRFQQVAEAIASESELELQKAKNAAYKSYDKERAMSHIRKATAHLVRAMMYYGVEIRE